jgi:hypothetical protein
MKQFWLFWRNGVKARSTSSLNQDVPARIVDVCAANLSNAGWWAKAQFTRRAQQLTLYQNGRYLISSYLNRSLFYRFKGNIFRHVKPR